jgi:hypothetical protein
MATHQICDETGHPGVGRQGRGRGPSPLGAMLTAAEDGVQALRLLREGSSCCRGSTPCGRRPRTRPCSHPRTAEVACLRVPANSRSC